MRPAWRLLTKYSKGRLIYFSRLQFLKFLHALVIVRSARSKEKRALTSDHIRIGTCRSRTNADDRLPRAAFGGVEGRRPRQRRPGRRRRRRRNSAISFCASLGQKWGRGPMQIIETRAVGLQAPRDVKVSAGLTLPPGLYQGTEERI